MVEAIEKAGYTGKVKIGMDVAASEFFTEDKVRFRFGTHESCSPRLTRTPSQMYDLDFKTAGNDGSQKITGAALTDVYKAFVRDYPVISIEDPFDQDDWATYASMTAELGKDTQVGSEAHNNAVGERWEMYLLTPPLTASYMGERFRLLATTCW